MNVDKLTFQPLGKQAILISWKEEIDPKILHEILETKKIIANFLIKEKVEVINTYNSLLIKYISTINNVYSEILTVKEFLKETKLNKNIKANKYIVPVCYKDKFALDLNGVCKEKNLTPDDFIKLHTSSIYTLYFIGFLPGFLYLGGLPKTLHFPRKKTPRLRVEKGSVGIGEKQTGIYPQISAGGWQIIGNCPVTLFDSSLEKITPFSAGDQIKFRAISLEEHQDILKQVKRGEYRLERVKEWE